jgi:hypothetical protein
MELSDGTLRATRSGRILVPATVGEAIERAKQLLREADGKRARYYWFLWDLEKSGLWHPADSFELWLKGVGLKVGNYSRYRARLQALGESTAAWPQASGSELDKLPPHIQRPVREAVDKETEERGVTPSPAMVRGWGAKLLQEKAYKPSPVRPSPTTAHEPEADVRCRPTYVPPRNGVSGRSCRELMRDLLTQLPDSLRPLGVQLSKAISSQWQDLKRARRERDEARGEVRLLRERFGAAENAASARTAENKPQKHNGQGASADAMGA